MTYYLITGLWIVVFAATIESLYSSRAEIRELIRISFPNIGLALILVAIIIITLANSFHGLEYEDAYEYLYTGNLLASNPTVCSGGLNSVCVLGSSIDCQMLAELSHPAGYSVLISWLIKLLGVWSFWGQFCSLGFLLLCSIFVYCMGREVSIRQNALTWGIIVCISCPALVLYGISGFSETASSFLIIFFLFRIRRFFLKGHNCGLRASLIASLSLGSILALAILVRRDNLLLIVAGLIAIVFNIKDQKHGPINWRVSLLTSLGLGLGVLVANIAANWQILNLGIVRVPDASPFSMTYVKILVPEFLRYIKNPRIFGFLPPVVVFSLVLPRVWNKLPETTLLLFLYVGLCLSFAHTYYFVYYGEIPSIHFERYLLQIWPIISLLVASTFDLFIEKASFYSSLGTQRIRYLSALTMALITVLLVLEGCQRRVEWAKEEDSVRFQPLIQVLESIPTNSWLVTAEPILVDMVSHGKKHIVDYGLLGLNINSAVLDNLIMKFTVYTFLSEGSIDKPEERYLRAGAILSGYRKEPLRRIQVGNRVYILSRLYSTY